MHSRGFRTSNPQRNVLGQSTDMSTLVLAMYHDHLVVSYVSQPVMQLHRYIYIHAVEQDMTSCV